MTVRDRLVVCSLALAALLGAIWLLAVSPRHNEASTLSTSLTAAQAALASDQQQVAQARAAVASYAQNLHAVKSDYRAIPATDAVAQLLPTLQRKSSRRKVDFRVITVAAAAPTAPAPASATPTPAPGATPAAAAGPTAPAASPAFSQTSFTFTFNGGYRLLQSFLHDLDHFVVVGADGKVTARNRLLVINSVSLKPQAPGHGNAQAAITASAYSQPAAATTVPPATAVVPQPAVAGAAPAAVPAGSH